MGVRDLSDAQLESRLDMIERQIHSCKDAESLPALNRIFQNLMEEQVRRDLGCMGFNDDPAEVKLVCDSGREGKPFTPTGRTIYGEPTGRRPEAD